MKTTAWPGGLECHEVGRLISIIGQVRSVMRSSGDLPLKQQSCMLGSMLTSSATSRKRALITSA